MTDFRIGAEKAESGEGPPAGTIVQVLIQGADEIAARFALVKSNLPYRASESRILDTGEDVAELARALGAATWERVDDEVPDYGFAERLGRRYREAGASLESLLLHWQLLRRAIHLVLADRRIRTGEGDNQVLREMTLMNYTVDWATEASIVGFLLSRSTD